MVQAMFPVSFDLVISSNTFAQSVDRFFLKPYNGVQFQATDSEEAAGGSKVKLARLAGLGNPCELLPCVI